MQDRNWPSASGAGSAEGGEPTTDKTKPINRDISTKRIRQRGILSYLGTLGITARSLTDIHDGINGLEDEEELSAQFCAGGLVVSHASDGWNVTFEASDL